MCFELTFDDLVLQVHGFENCSGEEKLDEFVILRLKPFEVWEKRLRVDLVEEDFEHLHNICETCYRYLMESVNIRKWSLVPLMYRKMITCISLIKSYAFFKLFKYNLSLECLDNALIFGYPMPDNKVQQLSYYVNSKLQEPCVNNEVYHEIPDYSVFDSGNFVIDTVGKLEVQVFIEKYYGKKPVLIKGAINHWPASVSSGWSVEKWIRCYGWRTVPVEVGKSYVEENWTQKLMKLNEFFKKITAGKKDTTYYLAQYDLFTHIPELEKDMIVPNFCSISGNEVRKNIWVGPSGTISPLHTDPYDNIYCQVKGVKFFRLISPDYNNSVYPNIDLLTKNTSLVDVMNPDYLKFPLFRDVKFLDCFVEAGDMLYIPKLWWHFVQSLTISFSVSNWF